MTNPTDDYRRRLQAAFLDGLKNAAAPPPKHRPRWLKKPRRKPQDLFQPPVTSRETSEIPTQQRPV